MRLEPKEIEQVCAVIESFMGETRAELRLYGSRVDDTLKGGDIDLVIVFSTELERRAFSVAPHVIVAALKQKLGERKIDLSLISKEDELKPFWALALQNSIVLCSYPHASHSRS